MFSIADFDDFCLWMYVTIDDWYRQQADLPRRPGPLPFTCSDSELLTMTLVGECKGCTQETALMDFWRGRTDLFPRLPSLSRFNRRRRQLSGVLQGLHQFILSQMAWSADPVLILDSVPLSVVSRAYAPHARGDWATHQASYGYSHSKRLAFYGYHLHVLMTAGGVMIDWVLTAASAPDAAVAEDLLNHPPHALTARLILADKGYTSADVRASLERTRCVRLLVLPKRDMRAAAQLPLGVRRRFSRFRQRIETLNSQLAQQFGVEQTTAHSFWGMCTRLRAKLTAHVCCVYANWLMGRPLECALQIKHLCFSN